MEKAVSDSHDVSCHPVEVATVTESDETELLAEVFVRLVITEQCDVHPRPLTRDPYNL